MKIIRIDFDKKQQHYTMPGPHTHDQYELYFLLDGTRDMLLQNTVFNIPPKTLCVIPPFMLHKTDGGPHSKISVYIPKDLLNESELSFLSECEALHAVKLDEKHFSLCLGLLREASEFNSDTTHIEEYRLAIIKSILLILRRQELCPALDDSLSQGNRVRFDPLILEIIQYLDKYYARKVTLKELCDYFFLSKATLCRRFNDSVHCSIMEYLLRLRISKAKQLLVFSNQSVEKISEACGFSSANYFGLIFKQRTGLSPYNYRKNPS